MWIGMIIDYLKKITAKVPKYIWILIAIFAFECYVNAASIYILGERHPLCVNIGFFFLLTSFLYILFSIFLIVFSAFSTHKTHIHAFYLIILMFLVWLSGALIRDVFDCIDYFYMRRIGF
jgi:hypothetical protein